MGIFVNLRDVIAVTVWWLRRKMNAFVAIQTASQDFLGRGRGVYYLTRKWL